MKRQTLITIYDRLNQRVFANVLTRPIILCYRWRNAHAQFVNSRRPTMEFNPAEINGLNHATSIVYHEMIHQYVEEYLGLDEKEHHGAIFWRNYKIFALANIELGETL